eukprot:COSAG02_NODE_6052_length_3841_cov_1.903795_1_plen_73_part_00
MNSRSCFPCLDATQFLLDQKAEPNCTTSDGMSPLAIASISGQVKMMTLLLDAGADLNQQLTSNNPRDGEIGL